MIRRYPVLAFHNLTFLFIFGEIIMTMNRAFLVISLFLLVLSSATITAQTFDGYALYSNTNSKNAYLIDANQQVAYTWNCDEDCSYSCYLMPNGNLMRAADLSGNQLNGAAASGLVQEIGPDGDTVWEFQYSSSMYCTHHDIQPMLNGNVLLVAWEVKTGAEAIQAGHEENKEIWPFHIIEVEPVGTNQGNIVWEWHIWDHLVQDHDPTKDNYGVVADHPELLDLNVDTSHGKPPGGYEWLHCNGIGYNEELDQISVSMRFISEVFIIDHSTTTAEAAGHTGGNSGMGGDILYRWGKPSNYDAPGSQGIPGAVHDVHWTPSGYPNEGYLMFFNNDGSGGQACVDAIATPLNGYTYDLTPGSAYEPTSYTWRHDCQGDAWGQSAASRLPNGNTFVCLSGSKMYEVDSNDNIIWQYNEGPKKAFRYTSDFPGLYVLGLETGLAVDRTNISAGTGGSCEFTLAAGSGNADRNYIILGGVTGTSPGTPLPGGHATLPINWDVFTDIALSLLNSPVFVSFMGTLDGDGLGFATLNAPALPSSAIGTVMYYAYTTMKPYDYVSEAVEVEILP